MFRQLLTFRSATVQKNPAQVFWSQQKIFPTVVCSRVWVQQPLRAQPPPQRALAWKQLRLSSALVCCNNLSGWCQWTSMGLNFPAVTTIITSVLHVLASTWCTSYCCMGPSHHTNWTIVLLVHCVICASSFACLDVQSVWTQQWLIEVLGFHFLVPRAGILCRSNYLSINEITDAGPWTSTWWCTS